jgi:TatD DNase family protein
MLVDTHCHLYAEELFPDMETVMKNAAENGISKIIMPNIDANSIEPMLALEQKYPEICIATMGLHPCYVKENIDEQLEMLKNWFQKRTFKAIGECGIDLYWDKSTFELQKKALNFQFEIASEYDLPLLLHTREATQITIDLIKDFKSKKNKLKGIFHCFSGNLEEAKSIIELGFYLGIGGVVTFKNSGLDKVLEHVSLEHIVVETDSPYLAPVPYRGKRNEPAYTRLIAEKVAEIKKITPNELAKITTENAKKIFQI